MFYRSDKYIILLSKIIDKVVQCKAREKVKIEVYLTYVRVWLFRRNAAMCGFVSNLRGTVPCPLLQVKLR